MRGYEQFIEGVFFVESAGAYFLLDLCEKKA